MAGINLSQSLQEKEARARGSFFDTGLYINIGVLVLTLAVFGGVRWYLSTLNTSIAQIDSEITTKSVQLQGPEADRVADFRERLDSIDGNLATTPDSSALFDQIEKSIVPGVVLTEYEEKWDSKEVVLQGETDSLKLVAQEMLALKKIPDFSKVAVDSLAYNKEGKLEFKLTLQRTVSAQGAL